MRRSVIFVTPEVSERFDRFPVSMPGRRFIYWLAEALQRARLAQNVPIESIAALLGVHAKTVERLEDVTIDPKGYSQDIDRLVAAYAYVLGLDDARELWQRALDLWLAEGSPPDVSEDLPGAAFLRPIREEARRNRQARAERPEKSRATGRKRGGS